MGRIMGKRKCPGLFSCALIPVLLMILPEVSWARPLVNPPGMASEAVTDNHVRIRVQKDMSVYDLISTAGYSIDDQNVVAFLSDFAKLNEHIKSLSRIRKGTLVKLPLDSLGTAKSALFSSKEKAELHTVKRRIAEKHEAEKIAIEFQKRNRSRILKNITTLSEALDQPVSVDSDGFKIFALTDKSELSLDAALFPLITMGKGRIVVLDYTGVLPSELKDLIEMTWPEYRVVNSKVGLDLKHITALLLDSMGYEFTRDRKVIVGAKTQIEYNADFSVYQQNKDIFDSEILVVGIIGPHEHATPQNVLEWLKGRGLRIVELSNSDERPYQESGSTVVKINKESNVQEFTESMISILGFEVSRGKHYNLSDKKEYRYTLKTDLSIPWGNTAKVIEFSELSDPEISYAKKRGFDIVCIRGWEEKRAIASKILSLLSLHHGSSPRVNASAITPKGVKYRLLSQGTFVHSIKGPLVKGSLFMTDTDFDPDILRSLMEKDVTLVTF